MVTKVIVRLIELYWGIKGLVEVIVFKIFYFLYIIKVSFFNLFLLEYIEFYECVVFEREVLVVLFRRRWKEGNELLLFIF